MAKFEAKLLRPYIIHDNWWITIDADSEEEAREKIKNRDYNIINQEMGDVDFDSDGEIKIDYLKLFEDFKSERRGNNG